MKQYTKNYLDHHGLQTCDTIYCEVCDQVAVDIHHIEHKGMGGSKLLDGHENLIALCRRCHEMSHSGEISKAKLWRCKI